MYYANPAPPTQRPPTEDHHGYHGGEPYGLDDIDALISEVADSLATDPVLNGSATQQQHHYGSQYQLHRQQQHHQQQQPPPPPQWQSKCEDPFADDPVGRSVPDASPRWTTSQTRIGGSEAYGALLLDSRHTDTTDETVRAHDTAAPTPTPSPPPPVVLQPGRDPDSQALVALVQVPSVVTDVGAKAGSSPDGALSSGGGAVGSSKQQTQHHRALSSLSAHPLDSSGRPIRIRRRSMNAADAPGPAEGSSRHDRDTAESTLPPPPLTITTVASSSSQQRRASTADASTADAGERTTTSTGEASTPHVLGFPSAASFRSTQSDKSPNQKQPAEGDDASAKKKRVTLALRNAMLSKPTPVTASSESPPAKAPTLGVVNVSVSLPRSAAAMQSIEAATMERSVSKRVLRVTEATSPATEGGPKQEMSSHNFNRPLVDAAEGDANDELVSHGSSSDDEAGGVVDRSDGVTVISVGRAVIRYENRRQTDVALRRKAMHINATAVAIDEPAGKGGGGGSGDDVGSDGAIAQVAPKVALACLVLVVLGGIAVAALWYFGILSF